MLGRFPQLVLPDKQQNCLKCFGFHNEEVCYAMFMCIEYSQEYLRYEFPTAWYSQRGS